MGSLGQYLRSAREARGMNLHDAAQHTRISAAYLKALEEEDFSKLPGEVFVKGFLKNYGKFLRLDESQIMKKYGELSAPMSGVAVPVAEEEPEAPAREQKKPQSTSIEPFLWGAGIVVALILFLFTSLPGRRRQAETKQVVTPLSTGQTATAGGPVVQPGKLYLEVAALEDTWLLVRTDNSPQKKALLKKGESLIWSADERFLLSYGSAKSLKLMLNGQELTVNEPGNEVVRDLTIIASGVVNRKIQVENKSPRKKRMPAEQQQQAQPKAQPGSPIGPAAQQPRESPLFGTLAPRTKQSPTGAQ
jgi:transcriptional regulator with XRE-family HTH domain